MNRSFEDFVAQEDFEIARISAIGGRTIARSPFQATVVQDLYLTTARRAGGEPHTPYHGGATPETALVVRKTGRECEAGVVFEHRRSSWHWRRRLRRCIGRTQGSAPTEWLVGPYV